MSTSRHRPARRGLLAVVAALLLTTTGCVEDDGPEEVGTAAGESSAAGPTTTTEDSDGPDTVGEAIGGDEEGTTTSPSGPSGSDDRWKIVPPPAAPGPDELRTALLTVDDLPGGEWESGPVEGRERDEESPPLCPAGHPGNPLADLTYMTEIGEVGVGFASVPDEEPLTHWIVALSDAEALLDDAREQIEACAADADGANDPLSEDEGAVGTYTVEPWSAGGDDSLVFTVTNEGPFPSVEGYGIVGTSVFTIAIARVGDLITVLDHRTVTLDEGSVVAPGDAAPPAPTPVDGILAADDLEALLALTVERVEALS